MRDATGRERVRQGAHHRLPRKRRALYPRSRPAAFAGGRRHSSFWQIPVMRHGDVTLSESRAICFYIDQTFEGPPLAPRNPVKGGRTEEWISHVNTTID